MNLWIIACHCKDEIDFELFDFHTKYGVCISTYRTRDEAREVLKWIKKDYPYLICKIVKTTVDLNN